MNTIHLKQMNSIIIGKYMIAYILILLKQFLFLDAKYVNATDASAEHLIFINFIYFI